MDDDSSVDLTDFPCLEEKDGLPVEAFSNVHEFFNPVDWDDATRNTRQHLAIANAVQERLDKNSSPGLKWLSPPIGAPNDVASTLGQRARSPPQPPPPPPPLQHSDQKTIARLFPPMPPPALAISPSPPALPTPPRLPNSSTT
ncbi:hypothetical protein N665_1104s0008 [Sinapis alba]|nr:hypothetical protein N665_1104s0008 [Sinapis alba]